MRGKNILFIIGIILAVVATWIFIGYRETRAITDDAQVDGNIVPIIARAKGYTEDIRIIEYEHVKEGTPLMRLDTLELYVELEQAQANLAVRKADLEVAKKNYELLHQQTISAKIAIKEKEAVLANTLSKINRYKDLVKTNAISKDTYEDTETDYKTAQAQYEISKQTYIESQANERLAKEKIAVTEAEILTEESTINSVKLQLSYCYINAPINGYVANFDGVYGELVHEGDNLMSIVQSDTLWVTAFFKETKLEKISLNAAAEVTVDAYPNEVFKCRVGAVGAATGSKFSLIPPDNATGNFIKVVQRVPVVLFFEDKEKAYGMLKPGMNVVVEIDNIRND